MVAMGGTTAGSPAPELRSCEALAATSDDGPSSRGVALAALLPPLRPSRLLMGVPVKLLIQVPSLPPRQLLATARWDQLHEDLEVVPPSILWPVLHLVRKCLYHVH